MTSDRLFSGLIDSIHTTALDDDAVRNIVSLRRSIDFLDDLSDDPTVRAHGASVEAATKPYHRSDPIITRPFEEAAYLEAIRYPFDHWAQSRFSDGRFGVWDGADSIETTLYETTYHWLRRIRALEGYEREPEWVIERRVHDVRLCAILLDLRPHASDHPWLVDTDPAHYGPTQQFGSLVRTQGQPGLINRSARCEGDVYAVFTERVLSQARTKCYLTYRYTPGADHVRIEREPHTAWREVAVSP